MCLIGCCSCVFLLSDECLFNVCVRYCMCVISCRCWLVVVGWRLLVGVVVRVCWFVVLFLVCYCC